MKPSMKKKLIKTSVALIFLFVLLNVFWIIHHQLVYGKYEKITHVDSVPNVFVSAKDDLTFSVSKKRYLNFGGNLGIVDAEKKRYLIIWPTLFKGNTYGFMMSDETQTYNFIIDKCGNLLNGDCFTQEAQIVYEENKENALNLLGEFEAWEQAANKRNDKFFDN